MERKCINCGKIFKQTHGPSQDACSTKCVRAYVLKHTRKYSTKRRK